MPIAQVLLDKISLRYYQLMWLGPGAETLEQALSTFGISLTVKKASRSEWPG